MLGWSMLSSSYARPDRTVTAPGRMAAGRGLLATLLCASSFSRDLHRSSSLPKSAVCVCGGGTDGDLLRQPLRRPMAGSGLLRKAATVGILPLSLPQHHCAPLHGDLAPISKARGLSIYSPSFKTPSSRKSCGKAAVKRVPLL